jgi:hypothetical protein
MQLANFRRYCCATSEQTQLALALHFLPANLQEDVNRMFTMLKHPTLDEGLARIEDWFSDRKNHCEPCVIAAAPANHIRQPEQPRQIV